MKLFSFWRSLATYRVRIALNLKGLVPDEVIQINLMKGEQREASYRAVNPMMAIPALIDGDGPALFESLAIIEYLDETHPNPPLLPRDPRGRARVRGLSQIVACDSHPLIVPRVREYLEHEFKLDEADSHEMVPALAHRRAHRAGDASAGQGHRPLRPRRHDHAGRHLPRQPGAGAKYFTVDIAPFPNFTRIVNELSTIDAFARAHPLKQPGAPAIECGVRTRNSLHSRMASEDSSVRHSADDIWWLPDTLVMVARLKRGERYGVVEGGQQQQMTVSLRHGNVEPGQRHL